MVHNNRTDSACDKPALHSAVMAARPNDPQFVNTEPTEGAPAYWPAGPLTEAELVRLGITS